MATHSTPVKLERSRAARLSVGEVNWSTAWDVLFGLAVALAIVFLAARLLFLHISLGDHYIYLARHMMHGQLSVDDIPRAYPDVVNWQGHKYLPFGPLPSILLIPALPVLPLLGSSGIAFASDLLTLLNIVLMWRILRQMGIRDERRKWVLLLFFGGTVYFVAMFTGTSWYFAHIVTTTFLLLAISEALGKKRIWLAGLFLGLAGMTRLTALFALPFFLWLMWRPVETPATSEEGTFHRAPRTGNLLLRYIALLVPLAGIIALLGLYNYLRFGDPLQNGYALASLSDIVLIQARAQGIFSLIHVPKNLFMLLLQGPVAYPRAEAPVLQPPYIQPSAWGMGLFFTSPALIYIFKARIKEPLVQACWLAVICVMIPIVTYYGVGWVQFGYRYALDFMPFLVLLAALALPRPMTALPRALILVSVLVSLWGAYWITRWL
jgi:hypothetical protein